MVSNLVRGGAEKSPERGAAQLCLSPELSELRAYQSYVTMCSRVIGPLYTPPSLEQYRLMQRKLFSTVPHL